MPRTKGFLHEVESNIGTSVFYEYNVGEAELNTLWGIRIVSFAEEFEICKEIHSSIDQAG